MRFWIIRERIFCDPVIHHFYIKANYWVIYNNWYSTHLLR